MRKKKSFVYPIVFMSLLTLVFVLLLAFLNKTTSEKIAFNQEIELQKKILYVFDIDYDAADPKNIESSFKEHIEEEKDKDDKIIYTAKDGDSIVGYAFPVGGAGLWGTIDAYVGISHDYSKILGLEFIEQSETPGLGGRIDEEEFKEQFRDLDLGNDGDFVVYRPASGGNVDAVAGATLTSQAVADFLNRDIENIKSMKGGIE